MELCGKSAFWLSKLLRNRYKLPSKIYAKGYAYQFKVQKPIYYPDRKDEEIRKQEQLKTDLISEVKMAEDLPKDYYYHLLGIPHNATTGQIKTAYYNLAKRYHPDSTLGPERMSKRFQDILMAYNVLSDDAKRTEYDRLGALKSRENQTAKQNEKHSKSSKVGKVLPSLIFHNDKMSTGKKLNCSNKPTYRLCIFVLFYNSSRNTSNHKN